LTDRSDDFIDKKARPIRADNFNGFNDMKISEIIENLVAEFGSDSDQSKMKSISGIICKAFPNKDIPADKAETLMKVGRKLKEMGIN